MDMWAGAKQLSTYPQEKAEIFKKRKEKDMQADTSNNYTNVDSAGRKRKKLTAQEKWQIFLETTAKNAPVGEILMTYDIETLSNHTGHASRSTQDSVIPI